jgi:hypothetical protein
MEKLTSEEQEKWFLGIVDEAKRRCGETAITADVEAGEIVRATVKFTLKPGETILDYSTRNVADHLLENGLR